MDYKIKMTHAAVNAANHTLVNTPAKGRSDLRIHSRIVKSMERDVYDTKKDETGQNISVKTKEGTLTIEGDDRFVFLKEAVLEQIKVGVPGQTSVGFDELIDALEAAEKEKEPAKV